MSDPVVSPTSQTALPFNVKEIGTPLGKLLTREGFGGTIPEVQRLVELSPTTLGSSFQTSNFQYFVFNPSVSGLDRIDYIEIKLQVTNNSGTTQTLTPTYTWFDRIQTEDSGGNLISFETPTTMKALFEFYSMQELKDMGNRHGFYNVIDYDYTIASNGASGTTTTTTPFFYPNISIAAGATATYWLRFTKGNPICDPLFNPGMLAENLQIKFWCNSYSAIGATSLSALTIASARLECVGVKYSDELRKFYFDTFRNKPIRIPYSYAIYNNQLGNITSWTAGAQQQIAIPQFSGVFSALQLYFQNPTPGTGANGAIGDWYPGVVLGSANTTTGAVTQPSLGNTTYDIDQIQIFPDGTNNYFTQRLSSEDAQTNYLQSMENNAYLPNLYRQLKCIPFSSKLKYDIDNNAHVHGQIQITSAGYIQVTAIANLTNIGLVAVGRKQRVLIMENGRLKVIDTAVA